MQCNDAKTLLNDHIEGELSPNQTTCLNIHLGSCSECREDLFQREMLVQRLNELVLPRAPDYFAERIKKHRKQKNAEKVRWFATGASVAAGVAVLLFVAGWQFLFNDTDTFPVSIIQKTDDNVHLLVHSNSGLDGVRFSVLMPESVELKGFTGKRTVAWLGKLKRGENILSLPLKKLARPEQTVVVRIEHQDSKKEYTIQLAATTS